jgi:hypothetical protein
LYYSFKKNIQQLQVILRSFSRKVTNKLISLINFRIWKISVQKLSISKSWAFDKVDQDIHMEVFSSETLRPNSKACFRCKSLDHVVKDCFLVEDAPGYRTGQGACKKNTFAELSFNNHMSNANVHPPPNGVYTSTQVCIIVTALL